MGSDHHINMDSMGLLFGLVRLFGQQSWLALGCQCIILWLWFLGQRLLFEQRLLCQWLLFARSFIRRLFWLQCVRFLWVLFADLAMAPLVGVLLLLQGSLHWFHGRRFKKERILLL